MKKQTWIILLSVMMVISLASCGKNEISAVTEAKESADICAEAVKEPVNQAEDRENSVKEDAKADNSVEESVEASEEADRKVESAEDANLEASTESTDQTADPIVVSTEKKTESKPVQKSVPKETGTVQASARESVPNKPVEPAQTSVNIQEPAQATASVTVSEPAPAPTPQPSPQPEPTPAPAPQQRSYSPQSVVSKAIAICRAGGKITTTDNLANLLNSGTITQEQYNEYYPYDGLGYYSVFVQTDLNTASTTSGRLLGSEDGIAQYVANMMLLEGSPIFNIEYAGTTGAGGDTFYEFRCYR